MNIIKKYWWLLAVLLLVGWKMVDGYKSKSREVNGASNGVKLYWFVPDGMRADETLFTVYKWAEEGKLPNIKKMMDNGFYGYSRPDFPSHTPVNFASLMTGTHPEVHGVDDGPMRSEGKPLEKPSVPGFASQAKKTPAIWKLFEEVGKKVFLLSVPGSTPPETKNGWVVRGRWGNWGSDDAALIFESKDLQAKRKEIGSGLKLFYLGDTLTKFVEVNDVSLNSQKSFAPIKEATLSAHGLGIGLYLLDGSDDGKNNYDKVLVNLGEENQKRLLSQGEWSDWLKVKLKFNDKEYDSQVKLKLIKVWSEGSFRVRVLYNNLNPFVALPETVAMEMNRDLGPMVDFVDNYPPQLIYEDEDKQTFVEESNMSLHYHARAADYVLGKYKPDVFIQDIYTPNQMLGSRWWMRYVDQKSPDYNVSKSQEAMGELLAMYQGLDKIIGEALKHDDGKTLFVLSSDHGMVLQNKVVLLNNLFASKGWLKYETDPVTGVMKVDWQKSKVVYLLTNNIFINPKGLSGDYRRASGEEYLKLRDEVKRSVESLNDGGVMPIVRVTAWDKVKDELRMNPDRVGDLVVELNSGYGFSEAATIDRKVIQNSLVSGNKQSYDPKTEGLQTPFVVMGPGVKKGYRLTAEVEHVDQLPTILKLMGIKIPDNIQGRVLEEGLEK